MGAAVTGLTPRVGQVWSDLPRVMREHGGWEEFK